MFLEQLRLLTWSQGIVIVVDGVWLEVVPLGFEPGGFPCEEVEGNFIFALAMFNFKLYSMNFVTFCEVKVVFNTL